MEFTTCPGGAQGLQLGDLDYETDSEKPLRQMVGVESNAVTPSRLPGQLSIFASGSRSFPVAKRSSNLDTSAEFLPISADTLETISVRVPQLASQHKFMSMKRVLPMDADFTVVVDNIDVHPDAHSRESGSFTSPRFIRQISERISRSSAFRRWSSARINREIEERATGNRYSKSRGRSNLSFGQMPADDTDDTDNEQQGLSKDFIAVDVTNFPVKEMFSHDATPPKDGDKDPLKSHQPVPSSDGKAGKSRLETIVFQQRWDTAYHRLALISILLNVIGLILATTGHFPYAKSRASLFAVGNILMTVLVRSEVFLRFVFWLSVVLLGHKWIPLKIKTTTTAVLQSVGGIHSGCGLGSTIWLCYSFVETRRGPRAVVAIELTILILLLLSCVAAIPFFRHIHHNFFERVHRFVGWTCLVLVWAYVVLADLWDPETHSYRAARAGELVQMQSLWLVTATTSLIILPWLFVRRVAVETIVPSTKLNTLLNFKGGIKPGILARISPSPLSEWHAFGIISDGQEKHIILAGAVGDFTKSLVENPPKYIWVRSFHFAGLPYLTNLYERALLVATGSGICVFLSFLMQHSRADVHIIWIAKNIQANFGEEIWKVVKEKSPEKFTVVDTAVSGRPRTNELVISTAKNLGSQVVIVTSNPAGTNEIVTACKAKGIPAFGPIWDS